VTTKERDEKKNLGPKKKTFFAKKKFKIFLKGENDSKKLLGCLES
jgi:hypothetical protein